MGLSLSTAHELPALIDALRAAAHDAQPVALATITATRGATFRRAGARMLVRADGRVVCELSGGCPQRDIVQRALGVIASGRPQLARYNAQSGLDVLLEMGCGGELDVLIEPLPNAQADAYFAALMQTLASRRSAIAATVFANNGEVVSPRRALWCDGAACFNELDDAGLSDAVMHAAAAHDTARASTLSVRVADATVDVLVERIDPPHALFAIGASATACALLAAGAALGWQTTLVDSAGERLRDAALPHGARTVQATPQTLRDAVALDRYSSVVVMTHNLAQDLGWLAALRAAPLAYLGAIGSRDRALRMRREMSSQMMDLHAPAGLDIGSETPAEIALAVVAEIAATLNGRRGGSLRDNNNALHP